MLEQRNGVLFEQRRMEQRRMGQRNKVLFDLVLQLWIKTLGWPENKSFPGASYLQHEGLFPPGKQDTRSTIYVFVSYQKWFWSSLAASPCSPDGQMCYVGNLQVLRRSPIGQICLDGFLKKQWKVGEAPWIWSLDIGQSFVQKVVFFRGLRWKKPRDHLKAGCRWSRWSRCCWSTQSIVLIIWLVGNWSMGPSRGSQSFLEPVSMYL